MDNDESNDNGIGSLEGSIGENSISDVASAFGGAEITSADLQHAGFGAMAFAGGSLGMLGASNPFGMAGAALAMTGGAINLGIGLNDLVQDSVAMGLSSDPAVAAAQLAGFSTYETAVTELAAFGGFSDVNTASVWLAFTYGWGW